MKRVLWTLGMAFFGYVLGMKGYDSRRDMWLPVVSIVWAAGIGFGFGTIFSKTLTGKRLIIYWMVTVALAGIFLSDLILFGAQILDESSTMQCILANAIGAFVGAMLGLLAATLQLKRLTRSV